MVSDYAILVLSRIREELAGIALLLAFAADLLLVPLIPTALSLHTFDQMTEFLAGLEDGGPRMLAFFSMVDRRKRLHRDPEEHDGIRRRT
jgi:cellulose biosynthesis protein BcsQ